MSNEKFPHTNSVTLFSLPGALPSDATSITQDDITVPNNPLNLYVQTTPLTTSTCSNTHHTFPSSPPSTMSTPSPTAMSASDPTYHHTSISHIDRDSTIALDIILLLVLLAIAWYVLLRIKSRRQAAEERATATERQNSIVKLRRYGARARASDSTSGMDRFWSRDGKGEGKMGSWSGSESSSSSGVTTRDGSITSGQDGRRQDEARQRSRSPSPHSLPLPRTPNSTQQRSHHRRKSSIHEIPDPFLAELQSRRPSQTQCDRRWGAEVARRDSAAHMDRRFSVLEPIPEPEEVVVTQKERRRSEAEWRSQGRAYSRGAYDWARPVVGGSESVSGECGRNQGVERHSFKSIVWADQCAMRSTGEDADTSQSGMNSKKEGIERVDWAAVAPDSPGPVCQ
jgi:hypothetical protein